jgi:hypothetical protein
MLIRHSLWAFLTYMSLRPMCRKISMLPTSQSFQPPPTSTNRSVAAHVAHTLVLAVRCARGVICTW